LKRITVPRLELAAATLLMKLLAHVLKVIIHKDIPDIYMWTDSTITYTWINSNPSRWKNYVHNRVCYIQEILPQAQFIFGYDNPADLATKGNTGRMVS